MERPNKVTILGGLGTVFLFAAKSDWFDDTSRLATCVIIGAAFLILLLRWLYESHVGHPTKGCLIMSDNGAKRFFTWRGRTDIHLVVQEEPPKQLLNFFKVLCDTIRAETPMEPAFNLAESIKGEIVYEISKDGKAKWKLLGGMNGAIADQVLVVNPKKR